MGLAKGRTDTTISYDTATKDMKKILLAAGHNPVGFTEHSGRCGGATAAAEAGASMEAVMDHGRWKLSLIHI